MKSFTCATVGVDAVNLCKRIFVAVEIAVTPDLLQHKPCAQRYTVDKSKIKMNRKGRIYSVARMSNIFVINSTFKQSQKRKLIDMS